MPPVVAGVVFAVSAAVTALGVTGVAAAYIVTAVSAVVVAGGAALIAKALGTLLSGGKLTGFATATRNPIAPWNVQYGRSRVGGTVIFINSFGDSDKYLDLVIVLAAHSCQSVDSLLLDNQRIQVGSVRSTTSGWAGNTFTPLQQTIPISSPGDISRTNNVVTVKLRQDIPLLVDGDQVILEGVHPVNDLLNGKFRVFDVIHVGGISFSFLSGGPNVRAGSVDESGRVKTAWPDYRGKIYMETILGGQLLGETFIGMTAGTPYDGDFHNLIHNDTNPWTSDCSLVGKTAVFLRLHYNDEVFSNGLPQISFLIHGKNDIWDPRLNSGGYTENAALCIADFLAHKTWGYKAEYGTSIPDNDLIAAANICDEDVIVDRGGTEPRYTCNGGFQLNMGRGEILQNLLTSCAGRLTFVGGQFVIWPAAWYGVSKTITGSTILSMLTGPFRWKAKQSITGLFNGVKGTYISPATNWQAGDFPRYAQDAIHGYTWGTAPQNDQNLDDDGGDRRWLDVQLPFTISSSTAQRIAKIELLRRRQGSGSFPLNMAGYALRPLDILEMDLAYFGWAGKQLEVLDNRFKLDRQSDAGTDVVLLGTEIEVQETDQSIYAWSAGEELSAAGYQQAIVPDTRTPAAPADFALTSTCNAIFTTWTAPADGFVLNGGHIEVQYQRVVIPEGLWLSLARMDPTITQAVIRNLTGTGDQYHVRIRSVNAAGVPSAWVYGDPDPITILPCEKPGIVTFLPQRTNYGEIAFTNIVIQSPPNLGPDFPPPLASLNMYVAYVEETEISGYAELLSGIAFDQFNPQLYYTTDISVIPSSDANFQVGDFCIINDADIDYDSPSIGNGSFAPLLEDITDDSDIVRVGLPSPNSGNTDAMPTESGFFVLLDNEIAEITSVAKILDGDGNFIGYTWGLNRGARSTVPSAHAMNSLAYHVTDLNFRKYEIFLITDITAEGYRWTIQRHWPGDTERRATMESWLSEHSAGKKIFKVKFTHYSYVPKSVDASLTPPADTPPGVTGGTSIEVPDYVIELPHAMVVALMAAGVNSSGEGQVTVYNCAQFDHNRDIRLPWLPGIRTHDGSSYSLPQFKGRIPKRATMPIPWRIQHWSAVRCIYATLGQRVDQEVGNDTLVLLEIAYAKDGEVADADYGPLAYLLIGKTSFVSWDMLDPFADFQYNYPPPNIYNNPYPTLKPFSDDEASFPTWGNDRRAIEGEALVRWRVLDNGGVDVSVSLRDTVTGQDVEFHSYTLDPFGNKVDDNRGVSYGDYLQFQDGPNDADGVPTFTEAVYVSYVGSADDGTVGVIDVVRGQLETVPTSHAADAPLIDISAYAGKDLTVVLQT